MLSGLGSGDAVGKGGFDRIAGLQGTRNGQGGYGLAGKLGAPNIGNGGETQQLAAFAKKSSTSTTCASRAYRPRPWLGGRAS